MQNCYSLGLDFGTNSVRALILDLLSGEEIASEAAPYPSGERGILLDEKNPHIARQHPADYSFSMERVVRETVAHARQKGVKPKDIRGIGVDTTGSTPLPVDSSLQPLGVQKEFRNNLNAQAWLWKDHSSASEAEQITTLAAQHRPQYLKKCGGAYSSEWFFSKIFHCLNVDRAVFEAAYSWLELSDYIPVLLCGITDVHQVKRNRCAAGHKAMFNEDWGGLPDREFLHQLHPDLANLRDRLYERAYSSDQIAGYLSEEWAAKLGLTPGIPVAVGILDAHAGAVGSGVRKGVLVKILGTSTCDIMVSPLDEPLEDIPGVAGIVNGSVLPGYIGIEAGQSAVGDIFDWFVTRVLNQSEEYHQVLTDKAAQLRAGQSGLLALDWNNGNRNILTDPNLTGLLVGQTLHSTQFEIYRALIEATAFGAKRIIEQMEDYGVKIEKVINCGGIAEKNPLVMQIYADILGRPMEVAGSSQAAALGAAIFGGMVAFAGKTGFQNVGEIQQRVCKVKDRVFRPDSGECRVYEKLYELYKKLHDGFGVRDCSLSLYPVMKELLRIKQAVS
ncbi:MAG: ribulokinase [Calditrichia bacterium]